MDTNGRASRGQKEAETRLTSSVIRVNWCSFVVRTAWSFICPLQFFLVANNKMKLGPPACHRLFLIGVFFFLPRMNTNRHEWPSFAGTEEAEARVSVSGYSCELVLIRG